MTDLNAYVYARRLATVAVLSAAASLAAQAQQPAAPAVLLAVSSPAASPLGAKLDLTTDHASMASAAGVTYSSSTESVVDADSTRDAARLNLPGESLQPPPRRSYGRPRYNDNMHNSDGSSKYGFVAAIGAEIPLGNTFHYFNGNYAYQLGVIRNLNKKIGLQVQFDWDELGLNAGTLTNQQNLYNYCPPGTDPTVCQQNQITGLDGNAHVWSFTVDPTYSFLQGDRMGAYVVAGVGFYRKTTNFTLPNVVCLDYYCQFTGVVQQNVDQYISNSVGFNAGFGATYKPSKFANQRLFIEVRYVFVDNSQEQGYTIQNVATTTYNGQNQFPANSNRTTYVPIKVGIRF